MRKYTACAGVAADRSQAPVAKKRAAVPPRAPGPPSTSAGAPPPPPPAEPSATELRAAASPAPSAPLSKEQALQQARAEGLTLRKSDNTSGYANVCVLSSGPMRWQASIRRDGRRVHFTFATAEEAALCVARSPEGQQAAERAAAAPPPRSLEEAEGLRLHLSSTNATGYKCVYHERNLNPSRPYRVRTGDQRGSARVVYLGSFATAVEAAVSYAQYVQSQQEAKQGEEEEQQQGGEQVGQQDESTEGAAGVPERSVDPSSRPIAAATRSFATRPAAADPAPCAADDSVEEHARGGSVRTSAEAQHCPLGVGQRVEAHYGVREAELWWPAVVTKVHRVVTRVRVRGRVRLW